jgi:hypothetical protein
MSAQQVAAPSRVRRPFIIIALLVAALAIGAVTAVNLFPTRATERAIQTQPDTARPPRPVNLGIVGKAVERPVNLGIVGTVKTGTTKGPVSQGHDSAPLGR